MQPTIFTMLLHFLLDLTSLSSWTVAVQSKWETQAEHSTGHILFQCIFLTQEFKLGLLHCKQVLCPLSHQGDPEVLKYISKILYTNPLPARLVYEAFDSSVREWCNRWCNLNTNTLELRKLTPKGHTTLCSVVSCKEI